MKEVKKLVRSLRRQGWTVLDSGKHYKAISPDGAPVSFARTPSCSRTLLNTVADLKRHGYEPGRQKKGAA